MDFCAALLVLFIVLGVVTLLGHGIWVLLATVFGSAWAPRQGGESHDRRVSCRGCGTSIPSWQKICPRCRLENFGAAAEELTDLAATARQLERFGVEGILTPAERDRLISEIRTRQRRLMGLPEPAPAQPAAAEVMPIPPLPAFSMRAVEIGPPAETQRERAPRPAELPAEEEILDVIPIEIEPPAEPLAAVVALSPDRATGPTENLHPVPAPPVVPVLAQEFPEEPAAPPAPPRSRRSLAELFATFMEEKNILWGELLGGLLIVGCSIALVISLWQQVEKIPYYPFIIVGTITAALFAAGLYTLHHWKLESTSRGLLVIATLLVPLNFLVVAGLHRGDPGRTAADLVSELGVTGVFVAVFFVLLKMAGPVLMPGQRWLLPLAVLGTSASQLLVSGMIHPEEPPALGLFMLLGLLPTAVNGLSVGRAIQQTARQKPLEEPPIKTLLGFLGLASFSLLITLGFQAYRAADLPTALHWLAPLVALAGVGPLAAARWPTAGWPILNEPEPEALATGLAQPSLTLPARTKA